jgi:hypothetical protein
MTAPRPRARSHAGAGPRKPMAKAARVTLFEREVRERLSSSAVEILLDGAEVLSEGQRVRALRGGEVFYGSTMLTIDIARAAELVRDRCDDDNARRVSAMMAADPRVGNRLREVAEREATRLAGVTVRAHATDVRFRTTGTTILVDIDLEGVLPTVP